VRRKETAKQQRSEQAKHRQKLQEEQLEALRRLEEQILDQRQENLKALQKILEERLDHHQAFEGDAKAVHQQELEQFARRLQWMLQARQRDEALTVMEAQLYEELRRMEEESSGAAIIESYVHTCS
jgi:hypothetical protein